MRRTSLPSALGPAFSVGEARDVGVSASRLRARDLQQPFHGIRAVHAAVSPTDEARLIDAAMQYAHRMPADQFVSHTAAAAMWGLPLPSRLLRGRSLDVSVYAPRRAPAARGVSGHVVQPHLAHTVVHPMYQVRVTSPASTVAMLASVVFDPYDLVSLVDAVVREPLHRTDPPALTTLAQLAAAVEAGRRVGGPQLRVAVSRSSTRSRSRTETWLRLTLEDAGLPNALVNFDVFERGVWLGQVDLAYPTLKIAIEYEGEHHLTDPAQWAADIARMDRLVEAGWRVIRVTKTDLFRRSSALTDRVRRALAARRS